MGKMLLTLFLFGVWLHAKSQVEKAGDILTLLIPAVAYGATLYTGDKEGQLEFYKSYATTVITTDILKRIVREKRPCCDSPYSFPSGHSSSAFAGAAFIHEKYGWKYAVPAYLAATFTAYSRVYAKKHYLHDVVAGALLGIFFSRYFATPYRKKGLSVAPQSDADFVGATLHYRW